MISWAITDRFSADATATLGPLIVTQRWLDAATGDDENDGLTPATAWKTMQRGFDEYAGQTATPGFVSLTTVGAGPYTYPDLGFLSESGPAIWCIADTLEDPLETFDLSGGQTPLANPDGPGDLAAPFGYSVPPYSTCFVSSCFDRLSNCSRLPH